LTSHTDHAAYILNNNAKVINVHADLHYELHFNFMFCAWCVHVMPLTWHCWYKMNGSHRHSTQGMCSMDTSRYNCNCVYYSSFHSLHLSLFPSHQGYICGWGGGSRGHPPLPQCCHPLEVRLPICLSMVKIQLCVLCFPQPEVYRHK